MRQSYILKPLTVTLLTLAAASAEAALMDYGSVSQSTEPNGYYHRVQPIRSF